MLALRILSGPQAGQLMALTPGKHRVGRAPGLSLSVLNQGVSKEHFEVEVFPDRIVITDLQSRNGTYVNGLRIRTTQVRAGDKVAANDQLFDVVFAAEDAIRARSQSNHQRRQQFQAHSQQHAISLVPSDQQPVAPQNQLQAYHYQAQTPAQNQVSHNQVNESSQSMNNPVTSPGIQIEGMIEKAEGYVDNVVMPAIYHLLDVFEMKGIVFGFGAVFIILMTFLSIIPMKIITADSVAIESKRRAMSIARTLSNVNEKSVRSGDLTQFSAEMAVREEGIDDVYIIGKDGTLIAPPERIGMVPKESGFSKKLRAFDRESTEVLMDGRVAAGSPILIYNSELQVNVAKAYAVVIYNPAGLTFDDGRVLGLFVQSLAMALVIGGILFFMLTKIVDYPLRKLKSQLDVALRENQEQIESKLKFPALQELIVNINSMLGRVAQAAQMPQSSGGAGVFQREQEMNNLIQLIGYPAMLLSKEKRILNMNHGFEALTGFQRSTLLQQTLEYIPDQAMQKNLELLSDQARQNPENITFDELDISGHSFRLSCQALTNSNGEVDFFVIAIAPSDVAGGASHGGAA